MFITNFFEQKVPIIRDKPVVSMFLSNLFLFNSTKRLYLAISQRL